MATTSALALRTPLENRSLWRRQGVRTDSTVVFRAFSPGDQSRLALTVIATAFVGVLLSATLAPPGWGFVLLGALAGAIVALPRAWGRFRLRQWVRELDRPVSRVEARRRLSHLADSSLVSEPVRVDAAGWTALAHLEEGRSEHALLVLGRREQDYAPQVRGRTCTAGMWGELVRSLVGRLFPEAGWLVVEARAFCAEDGERLRQSEDLATLRAALRLLEVAHAGDARATARLWHELPHDRLRAQLPVLAALVQATAARTLPAIRHGLESRVSRLPHPARQLVLRRFPELDRGGPVGYRRPGETAVPTVMRSRAPIALRVLSSEPSPPWLVPVLPRWSRWMMAFIVGINAAVGFAAGSGLNLLMAILLVPLVVGGVWHRGRKLQPLLAAGIENATRLWELGRMKSRGGPHSSDTASLYPFDHGELMLIVGLQRAEQLSRRGDIEGARRQMQWWLDHVDADAVAELDGTACAGGLVRMAALLELPEASDVLVATVRPRRFVRDRWVPRSGHGNAPRALSLALSVHHYKRERPSVAAALMTEAARYPAVSLDGFERELYGTLAHRLELAGHEVPRAALGLSDTVPARWADTLLAGLHRPDRADVATRWNA